MAIILATATAVMLLWSVAIAWTHPPLTPDSWAYMLLARSFRSVPYHIPLIRQYEFATSFNDSFPPVWPLILFVASAVLPATPWLGIVVASACSFSLLPALLVMLRPFVRASGRRRVAAAAAWGSILCFGPFLDEVLSGRSMPAALLLYVALTIALTGVPQLAIRTGLVAGAAAGLLWMTRFDAAPVVLVIGLLLPLVWGAGSRARWWLGYGCAVAVVLLPWVAYSRRVFGVGFATAPALLAKAVSPGLVTDWFPTPRPTIADAPLAWLSRVLGNVPGLLVSLRRAATRYAYAGSLLTIFAAWAVVQPANAKLPLGRQSRIALLITFALVCQLAGPVIIGGFDLRYFTPLLAAITLWSICLLLRSRATRFRSMMLVPLSLGLILGWRKSFAAQRVQRPAFVAVAAMDQVNRWPDAAGAPLQMLGRCLPPDARVLMVDEGVSAYLVAYYLQRTALQLPDNWRQLSAQERSLFLTRLHISHLVVAPGTLSVPTDRIVPVQGCEPLRLVLPPAEHASMNWIRP